VPSPLAGEGSRKNPRTQNGWGVSLSKLVRHPSPNRSALNRLSCPLPQGARAQND